MWRGGPKAGWTGSGVPVLIPPPPLRMLRAFPTSSHLILAWTLCRRLATTFSYSRDNQRLREGKGPAQGHRAKFTELSEVRQSYRGLEPGPLRVTLTDMLTLCWGMRRPRRLDSLPQVTAQGSLSPRCHQQPALNTQAGPSPSSSDFFTSVSPCRHPTCRRTQGPLRSG